MSEELTNRKSPHSGQWKHRLTLDDVRAAYLAERKQRRARPLLICRILAWSVLTLIILGSLFPFWFCLLFSFIGLNALELAIKSVTDWPLEIVEPVVVCLLVAVMAFPCVMAIKKGSLAWLTIAVAPYIFFWFFVLVCLGVVPWPFVN